MEAREAKWRCEALKSRIQNLRVQSASSSSSNNWIKTLLRLLQSELCFINRLSHTPSQSPSSSLSLNIGHLESVVHILEQPFISGVSRVCKTIALSSSKQFQPEAASGVKRIYVDIVCFLNNTPVWFIVSDRNPKYISWHGSSRNKGLRTRVMQLLDAARYSEMLRPSALILFFSNGLDDTIRKNLQNEFGAADLGLEYSSLDITFANETEDEWISVFARSYQAAHVLKIEIGMSSKNVVPTSAEAWKMEPPVFLFSEEQIDVSSLAVGESLCTLVSEMKCCFQDVENSQLENPSNCHGRLVNFDTTAMVAIVSGISNGGINWLLSSPESKLRSRFKSNYEFVISQVNSEITKPIHKELGSVLSGKGGIVCQSVYSEFQEIVSMCGGPKEKLRASYLLKHLRVVSDCPSGRMMNLPTTRKLALKNKVQNRSER
ncbi:OLC1v1011955C2 [Oldenlandia corymbosa var. corymbosa]|uniref:OLC1v1011955C2 n=1 Tax=Oldenlandia corymbosa var. corymbosa TaxID=529605 RepID=A0AAV1DXW6_OLDCO|nr:OLC1v1011955C2 [Oldenlandia corymbosa var. corymbosa]